MYTSKLKNKYSSGWFTIITTIIISTMNAGNKKIARNRNPREKSNLMEILFFTFTYQIFRKGVHGDLQEDDVYEVMKQYKSGTLADTLEILWKKELVKKSTLKLLRCFFKMFGREYVILGIAIFCYETTVLMLVPIFSGKVVAYFAQTKNITRDEALLYAMGLLLCSFTLSLFNPTYLMILGQISLKIRIAITSLLYRKCLKLNLCYLAEDISGMSVTLMTRDVTRFESALDNIHMISAGFFQLILLTCLMYQQIGVSALLGT